MVFFVSHVCNSELQYFDFKLQLGSLALIWYKKIRIPKHGDQDMSIFLYSLAFDCSCLLSGTALRFSSYLKLCISEFQYFDFTIKLATLALIWYKKIRIPKPGDHDMSILLYNVALDCSCLLSGSDLRFSSYLKIYISEFRFVKLRINISYLALS